MIRKSLLSVSVFFILSFSAVSQVSVRDSSIFMTVVYAAYSYQFPSGDLTKLFGSNSSIGGGLMFKTKSNILFGVEGNFLFGGIVNNGDSLLKGISTPGGFVIDANGYYADIAYSMRGYSIFGKFGGIISVLAPNPNSGITLMAGGGYFQDNVRIHNPGNTAPQILGDYNKGYDRLNSGFAINGSVGYSWFSNSRLVNLYLGFEFIQTWTKNKREYFFDTRSYENISYSTQYYGIKAEWIIPFYRRAPKEFYLY